LGLPVVDLASSLLNICQSPRPPRFEPFRDLLSLRQSPFDCAVFNTSAIVSLKLLVICFIALVQLSDCCVSSPTLMALPIQPYSERVLHERLFH
jgi:hypothetical protein